MTPNDRYLNHHKADCLANLLGLPGFPLDFLADDDFRTCLADLLPGSVAGELEGADEMLLTAENDRGPPPGPRHYHHMRVLRRQAAHGHAGMRGLLLRVRAALQREAKRAARGLGTAPLARKMDRVAEVFALDEVETVIVRFFALCLLDEGIQSVVQDVSLRNLYGNYPRYLGRLLGLAPSRVAARLSPTGKLMRSGILECNEPVLRGGSPPELTETVARILSDERLRPDRLVEAFYTREPAPEVDEQAFAHMRADLGLAVALLHDAWQRKRKGTNLLLYGEPGLGKTQFARLAAAQAGANAYAVPRTNREGETPSPNDRRLAYDVFQRLCRGETRPVLIVDEAESLLEENPLGRYFGARGGVDGKAWLTHILEENPLPTIWIVNEEDCVHPAVQRRFTTSVGFSELPPRVLERVWSIALQQAGRRFALDARTVRGLVQRYDLAPGHVAQAVDTWMRASGRGRPDPALLEHVIGQTVRLCQGEAALHDPLRALDDRYDPTLVALQGDFDVPGLERAIRAFCAAQDRSTLDRPNAMGQLTLLFHGPSGAGKTELAKHLAQAAGRRLQVERMSDLLSMWVGGSEKNIARAFERAALRGSILLLDEFDSLAYDRKSAQRSWEISQTNELLQQIENFPGVLIASTNLPDSLDQAISRRFSHKVGFLGIPAEKRAEAVAAYFADWLRGATPDRALQARLRALPALYPGDLRAVRQRFAADALIAHAPGDPIADLPAEADTRMPDGAKLVAALEQEAKFRKGDRRIGFDPRGVLASDI